MNLIENDIFDLNPSTKFELFKDIKESRAERRKREKDINILASTFISDPTDRNFEKLMKRMNWGLRSFMYKILQNNDAVDDVMSRTMEAIYFKRDTFDREKGIFSTWAYKIALNNCLKYLNDDFGYNIPNTVSYDFSEMYDSSMDDNVMMGVEEMDVSYNDAVDILVDKGKCKAYSKENVLNDIYDASIQCIQKLPDNLRIVMEERYIKNKKVEEISVDNKIPLSSVKNWLRKGAVALNEELKYTVPDIYDMYVGMKTGN